MTAAKKRTTADVRAAYGIKPRKGTMHVKHPKRGGWKGPKNPASRNHAAHELWLREKRTRKEPTLYAEGK